MIQIEMENGKLIKIELYPDIAPKRLITLKSLFQRAFMTDLFFTELLRAL